MKKFDILVISIVLLLSIGFYVIYFNLNPNNANDDLIVEIRYRNILIYEEPINENTDIIIKITSKNNELIREIDLNNDGIYDIKKPAIAINENYEILNIIHITGNDIHMIDANCDNKLCMNMKIGRMMSTPIFCTNGILIKVVSSEYWIGV